MTHRHIYIHIYIYVYMSNIFLKLGGVLEVLLDAASLPAPHSLDFMHRYHIM